MFQSTLPHGERLALQSQGYVLGRFNPRSRTGSDQKSADSKAESRVSFNPRSRTGSDTAGFPGRNGFKEFQSTLPHGERPLSEWRISPRQMFQSTLPHGERPSDVITRPFLPSVSIHAPARGATFFQHYGITETISFNPRSRTGSDEYRERAAVAVRSFNPRSRTGSDSQLNFSVSPP